MIPNSPAKAIAKMLATVNRYLLLTIANSKGGNKASKVLPEMTNFNSSEISFILPFKSSAPLQMPAASAIMGKSVSSVFDDDAVSDACRKTDDIFESCCIVESERHQ